MSKESVFVKTITFCGILICGYILAYSLIFSNSLAAIGVVPAILGFIIVLQQPQWGIYFVILISAILDIKFRVAGLAVHLYGGLLIVTFFVIVLKKIMHRDFSMVWSKMTLPLIIWSFVSLSTFFHVSNLFDALKEYLQLSFFFFSFYVIINVFETKSQLNKLLTIIQIGGTLGAIYGILQFFFGPLGIAPNQDYFLVGGGRILGAFGNPNAYGNYLVLNIIIMTALALANENRWTQRYQIAALLIMLLALLLTLSRGAWISLFVSLFVFFMFFEEGRGKVILILFSLVTVLFTITYFTERLLTLTDINSSTIGARLVIWDQAIESIYNNPLIGVGMGQFSASAVPFDSKTFNVAFNVFLQVAVTTGLLGLLFFSWMLISYFRELLLIKKLLLHQDRTTRAIINGVIISFFAIMIHGMVDSIFNGIMNNWYIGLVMGIGLATYHVVQLEETRADIVPEPVFF